MTRYENLLYPLAPDVSALVAMGMQQGQNFRGRSGATRLSRWKVAALVSFATVKKS